MATLTKDTPRDYALGEFEDYPVIASDIIYEGAAIGDDGNGHARPLAAGDRFLGFATQQADNSTGAAAAINVRSKIKGRVKLSIGSLAITDKGKLVYASDDNTFTLTQSTNTCIGYVDQFVSSGVGVVAFNVCKGVLTELTDNSGGTPSDTLAAIEGTYTEATIENTVASLAAKVNAIIRTLGN